MTIPIDIVEIYNTLNASDMNSDAFEKNTKEAKAKEISTDWMAVVRSKVESLRFGTVQITVHESKVVQIECIEKMRLGSSK